MNNVQKMLPPLSILYPMFIDSSLSVVSPAVQ